jgi:hypothetical protein
VNAINTRLPGNLALHRSFIIARAQGIVKGNARFLWYIVPSGNLFLIHDELMKIFLDKAMKAEYNNTIWVKK